MTFEEKYIDPSYINSDDARPIIVLKDKGEARKYEVRNNQRVPIVTYLVDGGIIPLATQYKCDYAMCLKGSAIVYFVELKGGDYEHALLQIHSTIDALVVKPKIDTSEVHARVVLSKVRVPNIKPVREKVLLKLLKTLNGTLKKESQKMVETL